MRRTGLTWANVGAGPAVRPSDASVRPSGPSGRSPRPRSRPTSLLHDVRPVDELGDQDELAQRLSSAAGDDDPLTKPTPLALSRSVPFTATPWPPRLLTPVR